MTASETPDELRARLDALAAVATERPWHHGADINRESGDDLLICEPDEIVGAGEWVDELDEGAPGGSYRTFRGPVVANCAVDFTIEASWEANAAFIVALVDAWPTIDALLARLTAAEADADRLRSGLRYTLAWFDASTLAEFRRDASGQSLYDEVAVLRERPQ
jgi:hypothetical protein